MAVRGSPAKGVDWGNRCVGSNPTFSATKERSRECSFDIMEGFEGRKQQSVQIIAFKIIEISGGIYGKK